MCVGSVSSCSSGRPWRFTHSVVKPYQVAPIASQPLLDTNSIWRAGRSNALGPRAYTAASVLYLRTASTLMMKGMTAQYLFRQVYPLKGGETILYHAAAGGVGLVACQWARAIGVTMIGTVSTDEKAEVARAHGCAHVIVSSREDVAKRVRELTDGKGVPVVYDSVGKDTLMASLDSLQVRGTLVSNGTSSGSVVIDSQLLAAKGSIWFTRPAMVHYATPRAKMLEMAAELFGHVAAGRIRGEPRQVFALEQAADAHRALESRATTGATVLVP